MDAIDHAILNELKQNGRASASEISKKVRLSIPAVAERIRKLEQANVIRQYSIKIDRSKVGNHLLAFIFVGLDDPEHIEGFQSMIIRQERVLECHHVAGSYDYLLKVVAKDTQALEDFLSETLKKIPGVSSSNTIVALTTLKEDFN